MNMARQSFIHSVMSYIYLSLFTIIGIALLSIFFSFWITEKTDSDAQAINLSGSMRMQTFHIGLALVSKGSDVPELIDKLNRTWNAPLFAHMNKEDDSSLHLLFNTGYTHWTYITKPAIEQQLKTGMEDPELYALLKQQVMLTDQLVSGLQMEAEAKIRNLRTLQLLSLLITTIVGSLIFYLLKNRIEAPLGQLTQAARDIGAGNVRQQIHVEGRDELSLLAEAFNQMSRSISETYNELEDRVAQRTEELQRNNIMLEYLFGLARRVLDHQQEALDYQAIMHDLSVILKQPDIEMCLFTTKGELPYMQVEPSPDLGHCNKGQCYNCKGSAPFDSVESLGLAHKYPIIRNDKQYGIIRLKTSDLLPLSGWRDQLLRSTADQLAIALSLNETKEQGHRLAMLSERTVIARELHDSLAQALSYLKIQVTRLQKSHDAKKYELQQPILDELKEGLSSAYRHLRELLTTFRLKIDAEGLENALTNAIEQLAERTDMDVQLEYRLQNVPLSPMEEIHLMQIAREASQNAINHSEGQSLKVRLFQHDDNSIELSIEDDGKGLPDDPKKLNHYGLAIMQERSKHLQAELTITPTQPHGTTIQLRFMPDYLKSARNNEKAQMKA